jgi:hypothetical protein
MVSLLSTKFHEILFSSFRGVALTSCSPLNLKFFRNILLKQLVRATPLKLLNRISWNLVGSKEVICGCAYYQEIMISWILWELCPFELKNFPKYSTIKYGIECFSKGYYTRVFANNSVHLKWVIPEYINL